MKTFGTFLGMILGFALLSTFIAGVYFLFKYIVDLFDILNPQYQALTAIASIVALLCALIIAGGLKAHQYKETNLHAAERSNIYERLLAYWCSQLKKRRDGTELIEKNELGMLEQQLILHASPKVITAYMNFQRHALQEDALSTEIPNLLANWVQEMRRDLGRADWSLKENDLFDLLLGRH